MAKTIEAASGVLSSIHETAAGLHRVGVIDKATMREFDALCADQGAARHRLKNRETKSATARPTSLQRWP